RVASCMARRGLSGARSVRGAPDICCPEAYFGARNRDKYLAVRRRVRPPVHGGRERLPGGPPAEPRYFVEHLPEVRVDPAVADEQERLVQERARQAGPTRGVAPERPRTDLAPARSRGRRRPPGRRGTSPRRAGRTRRCARRPGRAGPAGGAG